MKYKILIISLLSSLLGCQEQTESLNKPSSEQTEITSEPTPGLLYIKITPQAEPQLQNHTSSDNSLSGLPGLDSLAKKIGATHMERLFPPAGKFEARTKAAGLHLWYVVRFDKNIPVTRASSDLSKLPEIQYSEPVQKLIPLNGKTVIAKNIPVPATRKQLPFNDPKLEAQWHYDNEGTLPLSAAGADINLFQAWQLTKGSRGVIVAVVDGGIDTRHEDLKDNLWVNEAEKNGQMNTDDDGNGYTDDVYGYNFVDNNGTIVAHEHGTHVAGTVSAVNNNGIGVCGVAGGSGNQDGVRLMSLQIYKPNPNDPENDYTSTLTPKAIKYGADNGAVISQNSWGYANGEFPQATKEAIDYFIQYAGIDENGNQTGPMRGGIVIFAAGNDGKSILCYPGAYEKVISVASMAPDFKKSYFSNYGSWISITAPGGAADYDLNSGHEGHQILSTLPNNQYGYMQGTSMACPHVSGIAALIVSKYGGQGFTPELLKERLLNGVKDINQYNPLYTGKLGKGYIDANLALGQDKGIAPDPVTDLEVSWLPTRANLSWTITRDEDNIVPMRYDLAYSTQAISESLDYNNLPQNVRVVPISIGKKQPGDPFSYILVGLQENTTYYFALTGVDPYGNRSTAANTTGKTTTNRLPSVVARESGEITLTRYATRTILYDVNDPDGGNCTVTITDPNKAAEAVINGNVVTVTVKASNGSTGTYDATLKVTDADNGSVSTTVKYTILENRTPVVIKNPETIRLSTIGSIQSLDLLEYFNDPDNDVLTYSVIYSTSGIVSGQPDGNTLPLKALKQGETEVVITARDPYGQKAVASFKVIVGTNTGGDTGTQTPAEVNLYPNPVISTLNILLNTEATGQANIEVFSTRGARVAETTIQVHDKVPGRIDLSKLSAGSYIVKIKFNGTEQTRTIIKL